MHTKMKHQNGIHGMQKWKSHYKTLEMRELKYYFKQEIRFEVFELGLGKFKS